MKNLTMNKRSKKWWCEKPFHAGFSLVELVLTVALIAILLTLAAPSYRIFVMRAQRVEVIANMLGVTACQERLYAARRTYDTAACLVDAKPHYRLEYAVTTNDETAGFRLEAHPLGVQANDSCGVLIIDHTGKRSVGGTQASASACWSGR